MAAGLVFAAATAALALVAGNPQAPRPGPHGPLGPKIRAVTAFIALDRARYQSQVADALGALKKIKAFYERAGFTVETLRITTQPFPDYTRDLSDEQALDFLRSYDQLAVRDGFDAAIGPAMGLGPARPDDLRQTLRLAQVISSTKVLEGSVVIASAGGIRWDALEPAAGVIHDLAENSPSGLGNFRFAALAMVPANTPFYPASFELNGNHSFAVGLESANVVSEALASTRDPQKAQAAVAGSLGRWARQIEELSESAAAQTGWQYSGIDLSPAPLKEISIGGAIERFTGQPLGAAGTLSAVALITRALRAIPVRHAGYSGLMLPVLEDSVIAERWSEGRLSPSSLLLYSSVCGTGLDVIPMAGDTSQRQIAAMLGDVASLAYKWQKPLSARLLPVKGEKAGERTKFQDPILVNATIQPIE